MPGPKYEKKKSTKKSQENSKPKKASEQPIEEVQKPTGKASKKRIKRNKRFTKKTTDVTEIASNVLSAVQSTAEEPVCSPLKTLMINSFKIEDAKYEGVDFDVPPKDWEKEDIKKMRAIMRDWIIRCQKKVYEGRIDFLYKTYRDAAPMQKTIAGKIVDLMHQNSVSLDKMTLKNLSFSTFVNHTYNWAHLAKQLQNKYKPTECQEYWYMVLYPKLNNMDFSEENDKLLIQLVIKNKFTNWDEISNNFLGHTAYQCYIHFRRNVMKKKAFARALKLEEAKM